MISSFFGKLFCCAKKADRDENSEILTMETKVTDFENVVTNITLINCINNKKWSTNEETKPSMDQMSEKNYMKNNIM